MSYNAIGTILIATVLLLGLLVGWFVVSTLIYFLVVTVFGLEFSFTIALFIFCIVLLFKSFYPKNAFK